jgi:uncharacterized RDD family membrane protein YckC
MGEAPETVLGLDNVSLDLPVAGVGTRVLAGFVDYTIVGVVAAGWTVAMVALGVTLGERAWIAVVIALFGYFLLEYGYFAGLEILLEGQTPGKRVLDLRVVDQGGGRAETRALLVRNLVRLVDLMVGVPLMAIDPLSRRVGDRLGGTLVVHETREQRGLLVRRVPRGWQARDVAVVESYFRRRHQLEPARRQEIARKLFEAVRRDDPELLAGDSGTFPEQALLHALQIENAR